MFSRPKSSPFLSQIILLKTFMPNLLTSPFHAVGMWVSQPRMTKMLLYNAIQAQFTSIFECTVFPSTLIYVQSSLLPLPF